MGRRRRSGADWSRRNGWSRWSRRPDDTPRMHAVQRLTNDFTATVHLMQVLARACGHDHRSGFSPCDLTTWKRDMAYLTGVSYAGMVPLS